MTSSSSQQTEHDGPLLPNWLFWIYAVGPWLTGYLFGTGAPNSWSSYLYDVAGNYVPFVAIPAACHLAYATRVMRVVARVGSFPAQVALHSLIAGLLSAVVGLATAPLHEWIVPHDQPGSLTTVRYMVICASVGIAIVMPAVLLQRLRERIAQTERRVQRERRAALEAQLRALQARTNPHFLFNSINTVASLIAEDPDLAEETLERLADLFRYALDSAKIASVPLRREVEIVEDYLAVQAARFGERLQWSVSVAADVDTDRVTIPPLLLQPLVENAVLHGIAPRKEGGTVKVEIGQTAEGQLECVVLNDGLVAMSAHRGSGTSLREMRERLRLVYGEAGGALDATPLPGGGYRACLTLAPRATETDVG